MEKARLLEILVDWNLWENELAEGVSRENYLQPFLGFSKTGMVIILTGPRRSGKSTLLIQFMKHLVKNGTDPKDILLINLEDYRFSSMNIDLLDDIYRTFLEKVHGSKVPYIFLDEVHRVDGWERFVRTMIDGKKATVCVTGSCSKLLSKELATLLTGRHLDITIFPLDFKEFLRFKGIEVGDEVRATSQRIKIVRLLEEYLEYGGFPEVVLNTTKKQILLRYYQDIIMKDIVGRYKVRVIDKLNSIAGFYLANAGNRITFQSMKRFLGISLRTIERFSTYLEEAYLIFLIKKFHPSLKEQEKSPRKVYVVDNGLVNMVGFRISDNYGRGLENLVFLELKRRMAIEEDLDIYYWADSNDREVDFVLKKGKSEYELVQVCYDIKDPSTKERELKPLLKAMSEFEVKTATIVTWDTEQVEVIKGKRIIYRPAWKWLLGL